MSVHFEPADIRPASGDPPRAATDPPRAAKRPYLHQADLFRIITFACVVAVHVTSGATGSENVAAKGFEVLLHFTREAFFALTGFVLIYQYANRPFSARAFWRRRFALIGIPYVAWSVFYWAYPILTHMYRETVPQALWRLVFELATGGAWYQMYFLLVTMQVYLLFPLLIRLLRATEGHHRWVLAVSGALQLGLLWLFVHPPALSGRAAGVWSHIYAVVIAYQFYVVLGAVAAWHVDAVHRAVRRFGPLLVVAAMLATVLAEWDYLRSTRRGLPPWQASDVFMPHLLIVFVLIIAGQYTVSCWWSARRRENSFTARAVSYGSDRSFGVFLLHPLALQLLAPAIGGMQRCFGTLCGTVVLYLCVVAISLAATEVVRRIPGSLWLTGRPMVPTDFSALTRRSRHAPPPAAQDRRR